MKRTILATTVFLVSVICYSQSKNIFGAWNWRDSAISITLMINRDGSIRKHIGPINETDLSGKFQNGSYEFKDNKRLIITWEDKKTETYQIKLIDKSHLQIQSAFIITNTSRTYKFSKLILVDEEVDIIKN